MKLTPEELKMVRTRGFYVSEKCDDCGVLLNQAVRWTIRGRSEVFHLESERDHAFEFLKRRGAIKDEPRRPARTPTLAVGRSVSNLATSVCPASPIQPGAIVGQEPGCRE